MSRYRPSEPRAAATITGQTSASSVIDNRQARTGRLNQSVVAAG